MACFHPRQAFRPADGGRLVFHDRGDCLGPVVIGCGQCIGCRIDRRDALAVRASHEIRMAEAVGRPSWFPTFTVDDSHLGEVLADPARVLQLAHKRIRKNLGPFRFLTRFEYSPVRMRPHFHGLLFGLDLPDVRRASSRRSEFPAFVSERLNSCWPFGHIDLRMASFEAARYIAAHHVDKVSGARALERYALIGPDGSPLVDFDTGELRCLPAEFLRMSRRPGLGRAWLERYWRDVYASGDAGGGIRLKGGRRLKPPAYYDRVMADRLEADIDGVKFERQKAADLPERRANSTPERLVVREAVARARLSLRRKGC